MRLLAPEPLRSLIVVTAVVFALLVIVIAIIADRASPTSGSFSVEPEILLLSEGAPPEAARAMLDSVSVRRVDRFDDLNSQLAEGRLLIVDRNALDQLPSDYLRELLRRGQPIMAFNIALEDLYVMTDYDALLNDRDPSYDSSARVSPPDVPMADFYSFVYAFTDESGVWRTGSSQGTFSMPRVFEANLRQMALLAKGVTYIPSNGGDFVPVEALNTPPARD